MSACTDNSLNQLVTDGWSGTLSAFGSTRTQNLAPVAVSTGQPFGGAQGLRQTETATVLQWGDPTPPQGSVAAAGTASRARRRRARQADPQRSAAAACQRGRGNGLTVPAGDTTLTVTRTAQDQTSSVSSVSIKRPQGGVQFVHALNGDILGDGAWTHARTASSGRRGMEGERNDGYRHDYPGPRKWEGRDPMEKESSGVVLATARPLPCVPGAEAPGVRRSPAGNALAAADNGLGAHSGRTGHLFASPGAKPWAFPWIRHRCVVKYRGLVLRHCPPCTRCGDAHPLVRQEGHRRALPWQPDPTIRPPGNALKAG